MTPPVWDGYLVEFSIIVMNEYPEMWHVEWREKWSSAHGERFTRRL
jgi:hypothetical protein